MEPSKSTEVTVDSSAKLAEVQARIKALEQALLTADPKMPEHLRAIHSTLIKYEELSHLLSEAEITILMDGAQKKLGLVLAQETTNTKGSKGKNLKGVTADDL